MYPIVIFDAHRVKIRGDHDRRSGGHGPDLHRSSGAPSAELLRLKRPQDCGRRSVPDLQRCNSQTGRRRTGLVRREMGGKIRLYRPGLAAGVAGSDPVFVFDPAIRKIIHTTNAIESLNRVIRKSIKTRGSFPNEKATTKLIYLAIRNFEKGGRNVREWFAARNQFTIMFEDRFNA